MTNIDQQCIGLEAAGAIVLLWVWNDTTDQLSDEDCARFVEIATKIRASVHPSILKRVPKDLFLRWEEAMLVVEAAEAKK